MATAIRIPLMPLADITNMQQTQANKMQPLTRTCDISPYSTRATSVESTALSPEVWTPQAMTVAADDDVIKVVQHDPYNWKCLPDESDAAAVNAVAVQRVHLMHMQMQQFMLQQQAAAAAAAMVSAASASNVAAAAAPQRAGRRRSSVGPASESHETKDAAEDAAPPTPTEPAICRALVQFKCRQSEFSCHFPVEKGQYVVVQGDRGIDIGAVNRINTDAQKSYIERTGPSGAILRHATQREVDFWATELKADEAIALEYCRQRVLRHTLPMEVRHAEYQFDKKKLTFYYDAKSRVDFVTLLKELYREYGCRIWMEKVHAHE